MTFAVVLDLFKYERSFWESRSETNLFGRFLVLHDMELQDCRATSTLKLHWEVMMILLWDTKLYCAVAALASSPRMIVDLCLGSGQLIHHYFSVSRSMSLITA